jgi:ATP-dependent Clp protease ATP-binding subunit ClpB
MRRYYYGHYCKILCGVSNERLCSVAAIDLVDESAAKLKMEITSKPTALDEIDRAVLKIEMERLSLTNDTDKASKDRLSRLEAELSLLKDKQRQLTEKWEHEKSVMTKIQSIKEEVRFAFPQ